MEQHVQPIFISFGRRRTCWSRKQRKRNISAFSQFGNNDQYDRDSRSCPPLSQDQRFRFGHNFVEGVLNERNQFCGYKGVNSEADGVEIWAEVFVPDGTSYYYNTKISSATRWTRPEGPNIRIVTHDEWLEISGSKQLLWDNREFHEAHLFKTEVIGNGFSNTTQIPPNPRPDFDYQESGSFQTGTNHSTQCIPLNLRPSYKGQQQKEHVFNPQNMENMNCSQNQGHPERLPFPGSECPITQQAVSQCEPEQPQFVPMYPQHFPQRPTSSVAVAIQPGQIHEAFQDKQMNGLGPLSTPQHVIFQPSGSSLPLPPAGTVSFQQQCINVVPYPLQLQHIGVGVGVNPKVVASAFEWSEHKAADGLVYYYNRSTKASVWDKPEALIRFDEERQTILQEQSPLVPGPESKNESEIQQEPKPIETKATKKKKRNKSKAKVEVIEAEEEKKVVEEKTENKVREEGKTDKEIPVPTATYAPVPKTDWFVVWTVDLHVFYYNLLENRSVAQRPVELMNNISVDEMLKKGPTELETKQAKLVADKGSVKNQANMEQQYDALKKLKSITENGNMTQETRSLSIEERVTKFREMLTENQVSCHSTWERELNKIVYDERYLLLNSKERRTTYDDFVKERAEEERIAFEEKQVQKKNDFIQFLKDNKITPRITYDEFRQKYSQSEQYKSIEAHKVITYFNEFVKDNKQREAKERNLKENLNRAKFFEMVQEKVRKPNVTWDFIKTILSSDPRYYLVKFHERTEIFDTFLKSLRENDRLKSIQKEKTRSVNQKESKSRTQAKDKELEHKELKRRQEQDAENAEPVMVDMELEETEDMDDSVMEVEITEGIKKLHENFDLELDESPKEELNLEHDKEADVRKKVKKHGDDHDNDKEPGQCSSSDSDDESKYEHECGKPTRKPSLPKHKKKEKSKEDYKEKTKNAFYCLLNDLLEWCGTNLLWREVEPVVHADERWIAAVQFLGMKEMRNMFDKRCIAVMIKNREAFYELLAQEKVDLASKWEVIRERIIRDERCVRLSSDERMCKSEFLAYKRELLAKGKREFQKLLDETKLIDHNTKERVRRDPSSKNIIETVLRKDDRYWMLHGTYGLRRALLMEYAEKLERNHFSKMRR